MCEHKVLSHNQNGYIIRCIECGHFQIGFGTTVISFTPDQFVRFKKSAELQYILLKKDKSIPLRKDIDLPTFCENVKIMLNHVELIKLWNLIEEASVMLQLEKLLEPNEN